MADNNVINRTQLRKETHRSGFVGNLGADEVLTAALRRTAVGNYKLAVSMTDSVSLTNSQYNNIISLLERIAVATEAIQANTTTEA